MILQIVLEQVAILEPVPCNSPQEVVFFFFVVAPPGLFRPDVVHQTFFAIA